MKQFKKFLPLLLTIVTIGLFIYFFVSHPTLRHALAKTNPWVLIVVGLLYAVQTLNLVWVYEVTLRLCGKSLSVKENWLLTCYSTIANFFGPLQTGPGVRAGYLKQKHQVKLGDYTMASLIYYAFYALVSALFILLGSGGEWLTALGILGIVIVGCAAVLTLGSRKLARKGSSNLVLRPGLLVHLGVATLCQLAILVAIYFVELRAVHTGASLRQAIAYGGAANFALFVSLTPGAIGFREAFLAFSHRIHHIGTSSILAASLIDRSVYVVYLGVLFLIILGLHADRRFRVKLNKSVKD